MKHMKQMLMGGNTPYLPQEIIKEILKRLPVISLIRFQCVCKDWRNLIKSPSFIADQLHHSTHQNLLLLFKQNNRRQPLHLRLIDREKRVHEVQNPPLIGSLPDVRIIGSSNGLLCVIIGEYIPNSFRFLPKSLLLWNPATREVKQIPKTRTFKLSEWDRTGFGFNAIVNDYKIVQTYNESKEVIRGIEVYSLSTGSWREVESERLKGVRLNRHTVNANGSIFWDGLKLVEEDGEDDYIYVIVSFDIAMEVFRLIPGPPRSGDSSSELTMYDDKLAILSLSTTGDSSDCLHSLIDLWVLEEGTGSSTKRWNWTKKYASNPSQFMLDYPWTMWRNEIVCSCFGKLSPIISKRGHKIIKNDAEQVDLYFINIITNECNMLVIPEYRFGNVFNYVESLVPIGNIYF